MITKSLSHFVLGLIVFIWIVPFIALVSTSLRSETEAKTAGFWTAFTPTELGHRFSTHDKSEKIEIFTMNGNIFERLNKDKESYGCSRRRFCILEKWRFFLVVF